ncbi:hypothetical protein J5N97_025886 [Dioscorea zingiberensis]|uniref:Mitochondrial-processing peptidase subunit alpha n=1 Tax=Dioscorea zingiberensis TaxID=325984 RepID=A0A9D5C211_9LILI|nr:hypothetical protein J5N97_025886 [Dioscorea zingiberensis]
MVEHFGEKFDRLSASIEGAKPKPWKDRLSDALWSMEGYSDEDLDMVFELLKAKKKLAESLYLRKPSLRKKWLDNFIAEKRGPSSGLDVVDAEEISPLERRVKHFRGEAEGQGGGGGEGREEAKENLTRGIGQWEGGWVGFVVKGEVERFMQVIPEFVELLPDLPAQAIAKRSSGGFFSWLTGEKSSPTSPLDFPLPDVTIPSPLPDYIEPGKTKITTLPNGVKIASETSVVDSGSIYETPASFGASHRLERMAFKSTTNRSHLRIVREVEAVGGNVTASASREQMGYTYDALKTYMPEMVEVLIDCVRNPAFLDWEVNEQVASEGEGRDRTANNPQGLLLEALHSAGYSGALANPLIAPESAINRLNSSILEEFIAENYTASRIVLAASGVDHDELVSIAEPLLSDLPKVARIDEPKSVYTGAVAFEVPGGWREEKDAMTLTVLQNGAHNFIFMPQMLMGGGGSFSAGGPGKGMYSRLYRRVLNEFQQIESFSAFNSVYNNTGIFGIHATTVELDRAKASTKSAVLMNLESRMVVSEDIGRQILTYGERKPIEHFLKVVDEVTLKDITSLTEKIISSPLTMASWGDVLHVPSYESVKREVRSS